MDVTVGETVNNVFAIFLNANSTTVSAHAKARCEKTQTGCATWPLSRGHKQVHGYGLRRIIRDKPRPAGLMAVLALRAATAAMSSRVWTPIRNSAGFVTAVRSATPIVMVYVREVDQCVAGEPGVRVGNRIGINGSNLVDWYTDGNVPVRIPLFSGSCSGGYNIAGFGCFVLTSQYEQNDWQIPSYRVRPAQRQSKESSR